MLSILLHSSKTMRAGDSLHVAAYQVPALLAHATELAGYLQTLPASTLQTIMKLSPAMAQKTHGLLAEWSPDHTLQHPAIDVFLGDIYSGLQVQSFTPEDRRYANDHLFILSGLYGILRALDGIFPYRLEMGYRLPAEPYQSLYSFWGDTIARQLPLNSVIVNLSAVEYTKAVLPHLKNRVISPKFLTVSPKTGEPGFVAVHAKIARGAFAHWLLVNRIDDTSRLADFSELGYCYNKNLSTPDAPVFVCQTFKGLGLSVRLS